MRLMLVLFVLLGLAACGGVSATPTPTFPKYTADQVVAKLQPLGISNVRPAERLPGALSPDNTAIDGRDFSIPSLAPTGGYFFLSDNPFANPSIAPPDGYLLLFDNLANVAEIQAWYARFPDLAPYVYVKGNVLLQLNSTLPKAEAEKFRAALESLP